MQHHLLEQEDALIVAEVRHRLLEVLMVFRHVLQMHGCQRFDDGRRGFGFRSKFFDVGAVL